MTLVVADASVLVTALAHLDEEGDQVRRWLVGLADDKPLHILHNFTHLEVASAMRRLAGRGEIDQDRAGDVVKRFMELPAIRHHITQAIAVRIWELRRNLTAYDAAYVALTEILASREHRPTLLATADRKLAKSPGVSCTIRLYDER